MLTRNLPDPPPIQHRHQEKRHQTDPPQKIHGMRQHPPLRRCNQPHNKRQLRHPQRPDSRPPPAPLRRQHGHQNDQGIAGRQGQGSQQHLQDPGDRQRQQERHDAQPQDRHAAKLLVTGQAQIAYEEALDDECVIPVPEGGIAVYTRFPLMAKQGQISGELKRLGVRRMYPKAIADEDTIKPYLVDQEASTPGASEIAQNLLTLPTHKGITENLAKEIVSKVAAAMC